MIFFHHDIKYFINSKQHGFMKGRSIKTNLLIYSEYLLESISQDSQADAVYTDFSKSFDKINHSVLIEKLAGVGVYGDLLKWFDSYFSNRSSIRKVEIMSRTSKCHILNNISDR